MLPAGHVIALCDIGLGTPLVQSLEDTTWERRQALEAGDSGVVIRNKAIRTNRKMTDYVAASKTYVDSYAVFRRGLLEQQKVWMKEKVLPELQKRLDSENIPTLNILAFGSGFGEVDVLFLKELKAHFTAAENLKIQYTVVERNEEFVRIFQQRAEEHLEDLANVSFVWELKTCEEFLADRKFVVGSYHLVHFIHVLYYLDIRTVLPKCVANLLAPDGCLLMVVQTADSLYATNFKKYHGKIKGAWTNFNIVTDRDLTTLASENEWKVCSFHGERKFDVTDVFKPTSNEGGRLIDFFFHSQNLVEQLSDSQQQDILDFFRSSSNQDGNGKYLANCDEGLVLYFK